MISSILQELRPHAQWSLNGDTYEGLTWLDTVQTKPTEAEIDAYRPIFIAHRQAIAYQALRAAEYNLKSTGEQFGMQYDDAKAGTTTWLDWQDEIKARIPKAGV